MNEAIKRSRPVLGVLSIVLPAFGAGLWLFFAKHPHLGDGMNGYVGLLIWLVLVGLSAALVVGGITCAVMGLVRRERWRLLAICGLVLNVGIAWYFKR